MSFLTRPPSEATRRQRIVGCVALFAILCGVLCLAAWLAPVGLR